MPRAKSRQNVDLCGDCGASDATWASINKGILLCTQCCSVHRTLGRQISQVKHILKSSWGAYQLPMLQALNNNGANNIWEYSLHDTKQMKKKPNPKDPLSIKTEFIKAKHEQCAFAFRENFEDGRICVENELGKQLHSSVRTPNLETSFRLLAQGADPNYFHDEKGTVPLHVAVKYEQRLQVELLLVYGADPSYPDAHGKTPYDYARKLANKELADRLLENQYEVTDTFSQYLCMKKPDHKNGIHFFIPPSSVQSNPSSLAKLQKLPNHVFEELVSDVFDEVDRRQTESIWLGCADTTDLNLNEIPFLPVDATLSSTRNQGRQKLARFPSPEFRSLVYDILVETQRRQQLSERGLSVDCSHLPEEDPVYDSVASDDDYETVPALEQGDQDRIKDKALSEMELENVVKRAKVVEELTKALKDSDNTITDLKSELIQVRQHLRTLQNENFELKSQLSLQNTARVKLNGENNFTLDDVIEDDHVMLKQLSNSPDETDYKLKTNKNQRPSSMYETREGIRKMPNWQATKSKFKQNDASRNATQSLYASQDRETVLQCTEHITRSIQQLCKSIQEPEKEECTMGAKKVKYSIMKLQSTLSKEPETDMLKKMIELSSLLEPECAALQLAKINEDSAAFENHFVKIREVAFHLAKFTKEIVTKYSSTQ